jgi:hypothetical protein
MVGAKITINGESRIITAFTSSTVVTVGVAFSTNYIGVVAGSWGVYSKSYDHLSGTQRFFNTVGAVQLSTESTQISFLQLQTGGNGTLITYDNVNVINTGMLRWSSTSQANGTKDIGLRRNAAGVLEIYDGINANGLEANRRDLLVRNITASPATAENHVVVKSQVPTTMCFNDPISTTSTSAVLVRSVNIGALNQYKKVIVDTETHSSNNSSTQQIRVVLRNVIDNSEILLTDISGGYGNATIFKSFYINNSNIIVDNQYADNYTMNVQTGAPLINTFTPNNAYVVEIYINAISTETITNRGLTIQLYR